MSDGLLKNAERRVRAASRATIRGRPRHWALAMILACVALAGPAAGAKAQETVTITRAALSPDPPGEPSTLSSSAAIASSAGPVPSPLTHLDLLAPAGARLQLKNTGTCGRAALEALGPGACPADARAGSGEGTAVYEVGKEIVEERFTLEMFLEEDHPGRIGLLVVLLGRWPVFDEEIFTATVVPAPRPYGLQLSVNVPLISVLPESPYASTRSATLTLGDYQSEGSPDGVGVKLPRTCPHGGWAVASRFSFQDGSSATATRSIPCQKK